MELARTKICYVSPLSIHSYRWVEAFSQKGYDLSLITDSYAWVTPKSTFVPVYELPRLTRTNFPRRFVSNYLAIMRILKRIAPDFVHLHVQHYHWPVIVQSGFPFILTSWGNEVLRLLEANFFWKSLAKIVAKKARMITVDANCVKDVWVNLGISEDKIRVFPFGVDTNLFNPNVQGQLVRERLQIEKNDVVVISTRPFYGKEYNVECLVKAMPLILKKHMNAKFIIKGAGPLDNYLRNLIRKLNVSDHVRFVGLVPHHEVAQYLAAADIYVSTCFTDSTSVSLLEAMACGLPPVVTDIAGNSEWIENGVNGFLFQPRNPTALAEKTILLIEDKRLRKRFGERCIRVVQRRATWEKSVAEMEAVYKSLL